MSDLLQVDQQIKEGDSWRGTTDVSFGETETVQTEDEDGNTVEEERPVTYELTYRQLYETEFSESVDRIGSDNFESKIESLSDVTDGLSQEQLEQYRELSSKDPSDLSEDERDQLQSIADTAEADGSVGSILNMMDPDMVDGLHYAAKKGVVPDEDDVEEVLNMNVPEQQEQFGDVIQDEDKARKELQSMVEDMVDRSTGLTAYKLGLDIIMESLGGGKN